MLKLWTDGSAVPNPGPGGFAVILEQENGEGKPVMLGREAQSSNIRMEGMAILSAIQGAKGRECEIHTDSEFWVKVLTEWAVEWEKNEWHKAADRKLDREGNFVGWKESSIKNLDIVQKLYKIYNENPVKLIWIKGHDGIKLNEMADEWANKAREGHILKN